MDRLPEDIGMAVTVNVVIPIQAQTHVPFQMIDTTLLFVDGCSTIFFKLLLHVKLF